METMNELMLHFMQDIYYAEKRALRAMQKMARAASAPALKDAILHHREQTEHQITRLEEVFELVTGKRARAKRCEAIEGLVAEADEVIEESKKGPVLDAALIACVQAVEHYEIARYGALAAWARQAGKMDVADLLQQTLEEEKETDEQLSALADSHTNPEAADAQAAAPEPQDPPPAKRGRAPKAAEAAPAPKAKRASSMAKPAASKPAAAPRRAARK